MTSSMSGWFSSFKKKDKNKDSHADKIKKLNPGQYFNQSVDYKPFGTRDEDRIENDKYMMNNFQKLFSQPTIDLKDLRAACSKGIPREFRARCWKILADYIPPNLAKMDEVLEVKRKEYARLRTQHYEEDFEKHNNKRLQEGLQTIHKDVDRTLADTKLFQSQAIRDVLIRILYIYHARNSESGYAQGMNDIVAPFVIAFIKEYLSIDEITLKVDENFQSMLSEEIVLSIEADSYWCFTRLLSCIKYNYTPGFPGVIEVMNKLSLLTQKLDPELDKTLKTNGVRYYDVVFQWFLCLLLRQFAPCLKLRLLDFLFVDKENINEWLVYISAAFLMKFSNKIKSLNAYDKILMFFTTLSTEGWGDVDMGMLLAEAHLYKNSYNYAELHTEALKQEMQEN